MLATLLLKVDQIVRWRRERLGDADVLTESSFLAEGVARWMADPRADLEERRRVPVVIMTSSREEKDLVESHALGVNAYVAKPVQFSEFLEAVKEVGRFWAVVNEPPPGSPQAGGR